MENCTAVQGTVWVDVEVEVLTEHQSLHSRENPLHFTLEAAIAAAGRS